MNKIVSALIACVFALLFINLKAFSQTTLQTITPAFNLANNPGSITFAVRNNNSYPIAITTVSIFHNQANNGSKYTVWYHTSSLTGVPNITTANGWQQLGVSTNITASTGVVPVLTNKYLIIPPATTYRFAVTLSLGYMYYTTSTTNIWSSGGVDILTGNNTTSPGYAGGVPSATTTPATFSGSITFETAAPNNLTALSVILPTNGAQFCSYDSTGVKVVIKNVGSVAQSNFPVTAAYTSSAGTAHITAIHTATIQPFVNDTFFIGKIMPPAGFNYSMKAYTELSSDTKNFNDTTLSSISFNYKPQVPTPITFDDTVCNGAAAFFGVVNPITNTTYQWYDALSAGNLVNVSNVLTLNGLTNDTSFYISGTLNGCVSNRSMVSVRISTPPQIFLPNDTVLCVSKPLILDGGNPGGKYLWSTGDTTQTITLTTQTGTYWVKVDKYCIMSDTTHVTINPEPVCTGISYVRMGNTYFFTPSSVQNVTYYLWVFGDGTTSTDSAATHTYAYGIVHPDYWVKLLVGNVCGIDTLKRIVPTGIDDFNSIENTITVYPNPTTENIAIHSEVAQLQEAILLNAVGEMVLRQSLINKEANLSVKYLTSGTYFLSLKTNEGNITKPIQIVR